MPRGQERSPGPWPCYYLINFIPSSQYSSFPKAVLSIRVTIYWSAVTPTAVKGYEAFGVSTPSPVFSPRLPRCLLAAGPESAAPVGEGRQRGPRGCQLGRGSWVQGPPRVLGGAHLPPVAPGCHLGTRLLPAWLPGSSPAAALHPGTWVLGPRCAHGL